MSADQGSVATPAAPEVDMGPAIIVVAGQDAPEVEVPAGNTEPVVSADPKEASKAAGSEEPAPEAPRDEKGRFKPGVQDRIDELTKARREAEREAEYWKVRATGEAPGKTAAAPQAPAQPVAPAREQFASDSEYLDAKAEYLVDQKLAQREQKQAQAAEQANRASTWESKLASARAEITDFDTVMNNTEAQVAGHVAELIMEHDQGAKVAHFYASNPDALEKINAMSPAKAAFEIGRVASKFEAAAQAASSEPVAEVKVSKAPPPAARNLGAGRATTPELGDLSMDEYVARRKSQGASWAR